MHFFASAHSNRYETVELSFKGEDASFVGALLLSSLMPKKETMPQNDIAHTGFRGGCGRGLLAQKPPSRKNLILFKRRVEEMIDDLLAEAAEALFAKDVHGALR